MLARQQNLIRDELQDGTGASISVSVDREKQRSSLRIWFEEIGPRNGPVAELKPHGLWGHKVELVFGSFSGPVMQQIANAGQEDIQLARALISSIRSEYAVEIEGQVTSEFVVRPGFRLTATVRRQANPGDDDASVAATCREVIVPIMAAMAELIGYDVVDFEDDKGALEGGILVSTVRRRERNPRNRLLCLRIHGSRCAACGCEPQVIYGEAGSILEVHHLQPLSSLDAPRMYKPETDLVPLCPNCHRAIHTRRPNPFSVDELKELLRREDD